MPQDRRFIGGSFYRISDFSGFKTRSFDTAKQWNGYWVRKDKEFELRNEQDFVRGVQDQQASPEPRPRPTDLFLGPLITTTTAAAVAAAINLSVASSVRMFAGDTVEVMLSTGVQFRTTLASVPTSTSVVLSAGLPFGVDSGAELTNWTAQASVTAASL